MKTNLISCRLLSLLCAATATTGVFAQTAYTWTGAADRTNLVTAGNWDPNGQPNGATQDTAQWDGRTTTDLVISYGATSLPNTGFGSQGINFVLTAKQTAGVQVISSAAQSAAVGVNFVTNNSPTAALILGDTNTARLLNFIGRPAGVVHYFVNNSKTPAVINPSVRWQAGGGNAYTLEFGGTGDWNIRNHLRNDNGAGMTIAVDGPGTVNWTAAGLVGNSPITSISINDGTLALKSSSTLANQGILNNGTLIFDAAAQSQTLGGVISGDGSLIVTNGALTLSGASTFTGNTILAGGPLILGRAENEGVTGPLGVGGSIVFNGGILGFTVNNVFDYSARFNAAPNQAYAFDTGGQNVTFTNGLVSSGGALLKVGSGALTLAGTNTFSGDTTVNVGKLVLRGPKTGSGNIAVADSAILAINASGAQVTPATLKLGTSSGATLEFENVNSTTSAPLAAGSLSFAGTLAINITSGAFTVGQSYPLLTWTTGPAPSVGLGVLNGFIGSLSTNGNSIRLNITAAAYRWTGANNGNWDTITANNWLLNGIPTAFVAGGPVLFDDTASRTNITIVGPVLPALVTVNNSSRTYNISSSLGSSIGGSASLTKSGGGLLVLSGGANTYNGATTVSGGTMSVGALANGGAASDIGAANNTAANLVLNGGALSYTGSGAASDRLFTLGTGGGSIDASGSGALTLNNSGSVAYNGSGPRAFTLTGSNPGNNTLAASLADNGGATTLMKSGAGTWTLTGSNSYSGATTIAAGMLQVGAGAASGSLGTGNIVNNGNLAFNRTGSLTVSGAISGTGSVANDGTGTIILAGNNTYSGGTTISAGTLQVGTGGATGQLNANSAVSNDGTLIFNFNSGAGELQFFGAISGTGQVIKRGDGLLKLLGANSFTGGLTIDAGSQLQIASGNVGSIDGSFTITNNGALIFVRQDNGVLAIPNNIIGTGSVVKDVNNPNAGDVTLLGTNTYSGGTFIRGGGLILGDGANPGAGSITGNVIFTNSLVNDTARTLTFNRPDDFTFAGNIIGAVTPDLPVANAGSVILNGSGTVTFAGANTYPGATTINQGALQIGAGGTSGSVGSGNIVNSGLVIFNRSDNTTISNLITGAGSILKTGAGVLTLAAANSYAGNTVISNGVLMVNGDNAAASTTVARGGLGGTGTFSGPVSLDSGTLLIPGSPLGTLTINNDLSIGGDVAVDVNKSLSLPNDLIVVSGLLTNAGRGTLTVTNLGPALAPGDKFKIFSQPLRNGAALTVTGAGATWINNLATDGSISVTAVSAPPTLNFIRGFNNSLGFSWTGNFKLQSQTNTLRAGNWADYPGGLTGSIIPIVATNHAVFFRLISTP